MNILEIYTSIIAILEQTDSDAADSIKKNKVDSIRERYSDAELEKAISYVNENNQNLLHHAVLFAEPSVLKLLLNYANDWDFNTLAYNSYTPLNYATKAGNEEIINILSKFYDYINDSPHSIGTFDYFIAKSLLIETSYKYSISNKIESKFKDSEALGEIEVESNEDKI